jgi:hypothetical protein
MTKWRSLLWRGNLFIFIFFWCSLIFSGTAAAQADKVLESTNMVPEQQEGIHLSYQEYTNLIAGKKLDASVLAKVVNSAEWLKYAEDTDAIWQRFEQKHLEPMRTWATKEIGLPQTVEGTVFYPFSGPDVVNMLAFFPQAKNYLLIALEPIGNLPILIPGQNEAFYSSLDASISELLQFNFFLTKMMKKDYVKRELDGVLPVLLYFLGRENMQVLDIQYWLMAADGSIIEKPAEGGEKLWGEGIPGVKIVFQRQEGDPKQNLYYFSFDLSDTSWRSHRQFVKFLKDFAPYRTFVKAASYLMFKPHFSEVRKFILDRSQMVLQTDEGIPLKYFNPENWNCHFYGSYSCPIQLFAKCFQPDMADVYRNGQSTAPLPFGIGYHHRKNSSNLMLAARKAIVAQEMSK